MEAIATIFSLAGLIATGMQFLNWLKSLREYTSTRSAEALNTVVTQFASWVIGLGIMVWAAAAKMTARIVIVNDPDLGKVTIGSLDGGSLALAGIALGSLMSAAWESRKARDNTQSAATPTLVPLVRKARKRG